MYGSFARGRGWTTSLFVLLAHSYFVVSVVIIGTRMEVGRSGCMVNLHAVRCWSIGMYGLFARGLRLDNFVAWFVCTLLVCSHRSNYWHLVGGWTIGMYGPIALGLSLENLGAWYVCT